MLEPINLHSSTEFQELLRQRTLCGWDKTQSILETWRSQKTLSLFWIVPSSQPGLAGPPRHVGHIAMANKPSPAGKPTQHICNLFVLPEHRGGGLASSAVRELEAWARKDAACEAITLNALSRRYVEDDAERVFYAKVCASLDIAMPEKGSSNEDWYARMGYVKEREERLYPIVLEGEEILLWAAWLRKGLV